MPGLLRGVARTAVVAGTATAVSGNVRRRQEARWASENQQVIEPTYAPEGDDRIAQLEKLGQLRDQGVLTEEEFAAKKAQLLGM